MKIKNPFKNKEIRIGLYVVEVLSGIGETYEAFYITGDSEEPIQDYIESTLDEEILSIKKVPFTILYKRESFFSDLEIRKTVTPKYMKMKQIEKQN